MLKFKFKLKDDCHMFLDSFMESNTYAGLLEGKPNASINQRILKEAQKEASKIWPNDPNVILGQEFYQNCLHEPLPNIRCLGKFFSCKPTLNSKKMGSGLVLVWFQEEMFPLMEGNNAIWFKDINWNQLAREFDW